MAAWALNRDLALQMTLHADGITAVGWQLCGIHDRSARNVSRAWAMTTLATYACMKKCRHRIEGFCSFDRRTHAADVAAQATGEGRKIEGNLARVLVGRGHIPELRMGVPVDRRFKQEAILGEQIAQATAARTDVVKQLPFAPDLRIARALEAEPDAVAFRINAIVNARLGVEEIGWNSVLDCGATRPGHGRPAVRLINGGVTAGAGFISDVTSGFTSGNRCSWLRGSWGCRWGRGRLGRLYRRASSLLRGQGLGLRPHKSRTYHHEGGDSH
jgi:hypothetical protein